MLQSSDSFCLYSIVPPASAMRLLRPSGKSPPKPIWMPVINGPGGSGPLAPSPKQLLFPLGSGFTWFYDVFTHKLTCELFTCKAVLNLPKLPGVPIPSFKLQAEALV